MHEKIYTLEKYFFALKLVTSCALLQHTSDMLDMPFCIGPSTDSPTPDIFN